MYEFGFWADGFISILSNAEFLPFATVSAEAFISFPDILSYFRL